MGEIMELLTFVADGDIKKPLYHQLYEWIKREIRFGRIEPETRLPSKRKLASHLGLSQNTIQSAYSQLIEEGFVTSIEKKGYYVNRIDHLTQVDVAKNSVTSVSEEQIDPIRFDFSYQGVDPHVFPFGVWRKLTRDAINEYDKELLIQGDPKGHVDLRRSLAAYLYQSRGVSCTADQIVISSGIEFLFQILIQILDSTSTFGIENPGYEKLNVLFETNRARCIPLSVDAHGMQTDELQSCDVDVLCITPAHQFPSGCIMTINRRSHVLNWANQKSGRYIVEDDYDSEFKYSGRPVPALQGLDHNEKVIYIGAFSKSLSPAHRISYMVLPDHLMKRYNERMPFMICPVPVLNQKVLSVFMREGHFERHVNRMRTLYKKKREVLTREIKTLGAGVRVQGADTGLHLLLEVTNGMSEPELEKRARKEGVRVNGISRYYFDKEMIPGVPKIVIGFARLSEREICDAVRALGRAWF